MVVRYKTIHIAIGAVVYALLCSAAGAQMRGTGSAHVAVPHVRSAGRMAYASSGSSTPSMSAQMSVSGVRFQRARQASVIRISPNGSVTSGFVSTNGFDASNGVPGLGFDYSHLAAVSAPLQNNMGFRGGHGRHNQGTFVPVLFGGYPYYGDSNLAADAGLDYDASQVQAQQPQPQIIVIQQPAAPQQTTYPENDFPPSPALTSTVESATRIPDIGDFILVRRDGRILFASAFTVVGAQMRYVSPDGIRHVVPVTELDADATRQMNEARGTVVQITN